MVLELPVLPDDVLASALRRLAPRGLAASRCVCKAWRDIVDGRRLLRSDLLPHTVRGIFINYTVLNESEFLSRPSTGPAICGRLDFLPDKGAAVMGHCNGLLLCHWGHYYVVNPATRRWARLPPHPLPQMRADFHRIAHLVFDPTASSHYEVFLTPLAPEDKLDPAATESEWPPALYILHVFSSTTGRWEERPFVREGEAMGSNSQYYQLHAVYWRGALYVHFQPYFVIRISLSNDKYRVIKTPAGIDQLEGYPTLHLGRSEKGVYCAVTHWLHGLQVWFFDESCSKMEWVLKHQVHLETFARKLHAHENVDQQMDGCWILQDINYHSLQDIKYRYHNYSDDDHELPVEEKYEWNSDDDNVIDIEDRAEGDYSGYINFLGFHPFKEIVFLDVSLWRGVAYHWNNSKFQDLGNLCPKDYHEIAGHVAEVEVSFPYTPCWMEEFHGDYDYLDVQLEG